MRNIERLQAVHLLREMYPYADSVKLGHLTGAEILDQLSEKAAQFEQRAAKIRELLKTHGM